MLLGWLKGLLPKKANDVVPERKVLVFFDGDQCGPHFEKIYKKELAHVKYFWVQNSRAAIAKRIKKSGIEVTVPSDIGKESVDTYIAMRIVLECAQPNPPSHVHIISCDLDFVDVIITAGELFKNVQFNLMVRRIGRRGSPKEKAKLPPNARITFYRA